MGDKGMITSCIRGRVGCSIFSTYTNALVNTGLFWVKICLGSYTGVVPESAINKKTIYNPNTVEQIILTLTQVLFCKMLGAGASVHNSPTLKIVSLNTSSMKNLLYRVQL